MASDKSYVLIIEFDGEYESECAAYDPNTVSTHVGAAEALKALEHQIRTAVFSAANTTCKVKSLTRS